MTQVNRRHVVKTLFFGTVFSNLIGRAWSTPVLFELRTAPDRESGFMRIALADFPALAEPYGSVRVSTSTLDPRTNRQTGLFPPVIINRGEASEFYVLSAACTHEECVVRRLHPATQRMVCPCHGSEYYADGSVAQGPAQQSLLPYEFTLQDEILTIFLPGVFYEMSLQKVSASPRLQLSFIAFEGIRYEVHFRETLDSPPQRVPFALSPGGPLDQTEVEIPGDFARVYLENPGRTGFFEVAMTIRQV